MVTYLNYVAGSKKGQVGRGELFNGVYGLGAMTKDDNPDYDRINYTGEAVCDTIVDGQTGLGWTPVMKAVFEHKYDVKIMRGATTLFGIFADDKAREEGTFAGMKFYNADGSEAATSMMAGDKVYSRYQNDIIPQNDLPILNAQLDKVQLTAKARRIAIYYSQIAAFQAKTDYGFDLGDQLADQAIGELGYKLFVA